MGHDQGDRRTADRTQERRERQAGATTLRRIRQALGGVRKMGIGVSLGTQLSDEQRQRKNAGDQAETTSRQIQDLRLPEEYPPAPMGGQPGAGEHRLRARVIVESSDMPAVQACELPPEALLNRYSRTGAFADCYFVDLDRTVSHAEFVEAFYTTAVFKLERLILRLFVSRPSTDAEARQLAQGTRDSFAAWSVEDRAPQQLLLSDYVGRTRSWLMVADAPVSETAGTRLYFGSAVLPKRGASAGQTDIGAWFRFLLGFHKLYSRILLRAARSRLARRASS